MAATPAGAGTPAEWSRPECQRKTKRKSFPLNGADDHEGSRKGGPDGSKPPGEKIRCRNPSVSTDPNVVVGDVKREAAVALAGVRFLAGDFGATVTQSVNTAQVKIPAKEDIVAGVPLPRT